MTGTDMKINEQKLSMVLHQVVEGQIRLLKTIMQYQDISFQKGIKYLGFNLKTNRCGFNNWVWLYNKIERRIEIWCKLQQMAIIGRTFDPCKVCLWGNSSILAFHSAYDPRDTEKDKK